MISVEAYRAAIGSFTSNARFLSQVRNFQGSKNVNFIPDHPSNIFFLLLLLGLIITLVLYINIIFTVLVMKYPTDLSFSISNTAPCTILPSYSYEIMRCKILCILLLYGYCKYIRCKTISNSEGSFFVKKVVSVVSSILLLLFNAAKMQLLLKW